MRTPHQFSLLDNKSSKAFHDLRKLHGSEFAFHGSPFENWHSILRNGLYNASGTRFQLHGAAYGPGIYLSPSADMAFHYSGIATRRESLPTYRRRDEAYMHSRNLLCYDSLHCIALCEVIKSQNINRMTENVWVFPSGDNIIARFLFVYQGQQLAIQGVKTTVPEFAGLLRQAVDRYEEASNDNHRQDGEI